MISKLKIKKIKKASAASIALLFISGLLAYTFISEKETKTKQPNLALKQQKALAHCEGLTLTRYITYSLPH